MRDRVCVMVAAAGAPWESDALRRLDTAGPAVTLLKRCVDLPDLLASAMTGEADVALVADHLSGLDADSVAHLRRCGVGVVVVTDGEESDGGARSRFHRIGVEQLVVGPVLEGLTAALLAEGGEQRPSPAEAGAEEQAAEEQPRGRLLAVWGAAGAPGRTTVAVGLAAELAARGRPTLLVDADPYGGVVAQHLGVLEEVSGLLAATRLANAGQLDVGRLAECARQVGPDLRLLTGLPRADRWAEVRGGAFESVLGLAAGMVGGPTGAVVVDTGFSLEEDAAGGFGSPAPQRNQMTRSTLERADEVLVVGSADPVGVSRLARALVSLVDAVPGVRVRVVVNRMRASLGWSRDEVAALLGDFGAAQEPAFLPEDRAGCDRALVAGRSLVEIGDSALGRALAELADVVAGEPARVRRRAPFRR